VTDPLLADFGTGPSVPREDAALISKTRYRRGFWVTVLAVSLMALAPLVLMTWVNYNQYRQAFRAEQTRPLVRFLANGKQSLEDFLEARTAALHYVLLDHGQEELRNPDFLAGALQNLQTSFGGFVDLGFILSDGTQVAYAGPFELEGENYRAFPWFQQVTRQGSYVSEVFMGLRSSPHFIVAVYRQGPDGRGFVLRATIDTDYINRLVRSLIHQPGEDAFLVNQNGILQTTSRSHGGILESANIPSLPVSLQPEIHPLVDSIGHEHDLVYASVAGSPFTMVLLSRDIDDATGWAGLRRNLLLFLSLSTVLILGVVLWGSRWAMKRVWEADMVRAAAFHKMEYQNKMAALGRLSAGVAHEINNPVSIITQNAGLFKDLLEMSETPPSKERMLELLESVIRSADRCGGITHRLLGFAKHMDIQAETINLKELLLEVLGFLEKEAEYRDINVTFDFPEEDLTIKSDRGQLQQVFLNIINNAFAAVADGGNIQLGISETDSYHVSVWILDDGVGIPEENLRSIFEPFFSTKKGTGTGLGLSITYGIAQKLGGEVSVQSRVGAGTRFVVTLPKGDPEDQES
jgi:signal transduction histidine kinase